MEAYVALLFILMSVNAVSGGDISILDGSFKITKPTGSITFNRYQDISIEFEVGLENSDTTEEDLNSIELHFSDGSATLSDPIAVTGAPAKVPSSADGTDGKGLFKDLKADVKILDATECSSFTKLCVEVDPDDDTECIDASVYCNALAFKADTISVTAPTTYMLNRVQATTLTFNAGLFNADATETPITSYKLYLSDNEDLDAGGAKVSAAIDVAGAPTTVPASADGTADKGLTTGMTSAVKIESADDCSDYNKLCLKVEYASTSATGCFDLTDKTDCDLSMALKTDSFSITGPSTYKLNTDTETTLTFSAALLNIGASEVALTSYKLHLSDNTDLSATGAKVSEAIDVTGAPDKVPAGADGTADKGLTTGMTSAVKIESAEDCSAYKWTCLKVEPGPLSDCIDVSDNIDCKDSGAEIAKLSLFAVVLILTSIFLPFQQ